MANTFTEPGDRRNADALLQVSISANREVFVRTVMNSLRLDDQGEDTLRLTEEHMKRVSIKDFLLYCDRNIEWFVLDR